MFGATLDESWEDLPPRQLADSWLQEAGVWDGDLTEHERDCRYVRFSGCDFGVAPRDEWPSMRQDLLEFEQKLACK